MPTQPNARVLADSISPSGHRLTTLEVTMHRFVLAEFNTHRMFSRNSASSRARPIEKVIEQVLTDPAIPVEWGSNKKGMQAGEPLSEDEAHIAHQLWESARAHAADHALKLAKLGVHKQIANRLLEPFLWHTVIVTATEWDNFFKQRLSPLAQPEIRAAASAMYDALVGSSPCHVRHGQWHLPLIDWEDRAVYADNEYLCMISAARCARVSYLTQNGERDRNEDLALYRRLVNARPMHASPLEHVAQPCGNRWSANFYGWQSLRAQVEDKLGIDSRSEWMHVLHQA